MNSPDVRTQAGRVRFVFHHGNEKERASILKMLSDWIYRYNEHVQFYNQKLSETISLRNELQNYQGAGSDQVADQAQLKYPDKITDGGPE